MAGVCFHYRFAGRLIGRLVTMLPLVVGCAQWMEEPSPVVQSARTYERHRLWEVADPTGSHSPVTSQPTDKADPLARPYRLNTENIVHILYEEAPGIAASRQSMVAARHGLEEFKADLSRFEPFVNC